MGIFQAGSSGSSEPVPVVKFFFLFFLILTAKELALRTNTAGPEQGTAHIRGFLKFRYSNAEKISNLMS